MVTTKQRQIVDKALKAHDENPSYKLSYEEHQAFSAYMKEKGIPTTADKRASYKIFEYRLHIAIVGTLIVFVTWDAYTSHNGIYQVANGVLILCCSYWLFVRFTKYKKRMTQIEQEKIDDKEFEDYQWQRDAIHIKYDPREEWNEATSLPREYLNEIKKLDFEFQDVLFRRVQRFGL